MAAAKQLLSQAASWQQAGAGSCMPTDWRLPVPATHPRRCRRRGWRARWLRCCAWRARHGAWRRRRWQGRSSGTPTSACWRRAGELLRGGVLLLVYGQAPACVLGSTTCCLNLRSRCRACTPNHAAVHLRLPHRPHRPVLQLHQRHDLRLPLPLRPGALLVSAQAEAACDVSWHLHICIW